MQDDDMLYFNESLKLETLVHVMKREHDLDIPLHSHAHIEIVYVLSGHMTQTANSLEYKLQRGDLLFLNSGSSHKFTSDEECSYINVLFMPELIVSDILSADNAFSHLALSSFHEIFSDTNNGIITFSGNERVVFENLVLAMLAEYKEKRVFWQKMLLNYLNVLINHICRKIQYGLEPSEIGDMWNEISEYIDQNISIKLSLNELASKCFYTPNYFSKIFKDKFGMPMTEYITRKRIDHAINLLTGSNLSIDEIAIQVGFADRSTLYHAFSKYIGRTPTQYRGKNVTT